MQVVSDIQSLSRQIAAWRAHGLRVGFVPTMGNLHAGHIALVTHARSLCDVVVASVFVNPAQFGPGEDFAIYPRTLDADCAALEAAQTDLVFTPSEQTVYPAGSSDRASRDTPGLYAIFEGRSRPGHFAGVAQVVRRLFELVRPDVAVFGAKDYQQLLVIRHMVARAGLSVAIVAHATVRETDGLAMSSRNAYLSAEQRAAAPAIYRVLLAAASQLRQGEAVPAVERAGLKALSRVGFTVDYFAVRAADDLGEPISQERELVVLAAVVVGSTRLIDNLRVTVDGGGDIADNANSDQA